MRRPERFFWAVAAVMPWAGELGIIELHYLRAGDWHLADTDDAADLLRARPPDPGPTMLDAHVET